MAYQSKIKYGYRAGGGGGGTGLIARLLGSDQTVEENQPANTAAIFGDEGQQRFLDKEGALTTNQFIDARNFWDRLAGLPNRAEDINLAIAGQRALMPVDIEKARRLGEVKNEQELTQKKALGPIKAKNMALETLAAKFGVTPEQAETMFPLQLEAAIAEVRAGEAGAKERSAKAETGRVTEEATRSSRVKTAANTADLNSILSQASLAFAQNPANAALLNADIASGYLKGPVGVRGAADVTLGPNQTLFRQPLPGLSLFGSGTMSGGRTKETPQTINIGGQEFPTGRTSTTITPAENRVRIPFDPSRVSGIDQTSPLPEWMGLPGVPVTPESITSAPRTMPGRSSGVRKTSDLPPEMLEAQPKENKSFIQTILNALRSSDKTNSFLSSIPVTKQAELFRPSFGDLRLSTTSDVLPASTIQEGPSVTAQQEEYLTSPETVLIKSDYANLSNTQKQEIINWIMSNPGASRSRIEEVVNFVKRERK